MLAQQRPATKLPRAGAWVARIGKLSWAERRPLGSWETPRLISLEWEMVPEGCVSERQRGGGEAWAPSVWTDTAQDVREAVGQAG